MTIKNICIFLLLIFASHLFANAQPDSTVIAGEIKDPLKEGNVFTCKVIRPGAPLFGQTGFSQSFNAIISNGHFRLAIPARYDWFDVTFYSVDSSGNQTLYNNDNSSETTYLLQKGDQINLVIQPDGLIDFFGKSSLRLTCQENIYRLHYLPESVLNAVNYLLKNKEYVAGYSVNLKFLEEQVKMKHMILETYRDSLPASIYRRINADLLGQSYRPFLYTLSLRYQDSSANIAAKDFFPTLNTHFPTADSNYDAVSSSLYADMFLYKTLDEIMYNSAVGSSKKIEFSELFNRVSNEYSGAFRDKLLLLVFLNYARKDPGSINYLDRAFAEMGNDESKDLLKEWAITHKSGVPAYAFDLSDENGKRFKMNDFRGKIIVADFWFYGCEGCLGIPPAMKNVCEKYAGNKQVVFLSINVDSKRATWESGLKSGQYTIQGAIHLSLLELARDNALIKYYGYDSYPQLLVIGQDGNVVSAYPPDPRLDNGEKKKN